MNNKPPNQWMGFYVPSPGYVLSLVIVGGVLSFLFGEVFNIANPASLFLNFVIISFFVASGLNISSHKYAFFHRVVFVLLIIALAVIPYPWE